jgi:hypothetical protein
MIHKTAQLTKIRLQGFDVKENCFLLLDLYQYILP